MVRIVKSLIKWLTVWFAICGLFSLSPALFAQYTLQYSTNGSVITLTGHTGTPVNVSIPNFVTSIGVSAFYNCGSLTNVTIPDSVTSIGDYAFAGCAGLSSLTIGNNVTNIGQEAFEECSDLATVTIPDSVISIGEYVFASCTDLTTLTIGSGITNIPADAFADCTHLTNVTIPNSATSIGEEAFSSCTSLTNVTIPDSVTSVGAFAFYDCSFTSVTIPDSVTSIGQEAFLECPDLAGVSIGRGVTNIGEEAFLNCPSLTGILFLGNAPVLGSQVFKDDLTTVSVYYLDGTSGWESTYGGLPTVGLGLPEIAITVQPTNQTVAGNGNATFAVSALSPLPLSYQWLFLNGANYSNEAEGYAQMLDGFVYGVVITNAGSGYIAPPPVQFIGGGGSGAAGTAIVSNGMVSGITVTDAGSGYTNLPLVQIAPPGEVLIAETNATLNLTDLAANNAGSYYAAVSNAYGSVLSAGGALTVAYSPGIVQQPQSTDVVQGQSAKFNVIATGIPAPSFQWWMVGEPQGTATATPVVIDGFVLGANMTSGGAGYLSAPSVQIVGGNGSGAAGHALVSNEMVTAVVMTDAGSNYTTTPSIQIAPPTPSALHGQTSSNLTLSDVVVTNTAGYFVVVTNSFGSVTSAVASLTVFLPLQYFKASLAGANQLTLQSIGTPNFPYVLQSTTNLAPPIHWQPVITNLTDSNGNWALSVMNLALPQSFYRVYGQ